jgi:prepilin peptidase CpaA
MLSQPSLPAAGQILLGVLSVTAAISDLRFRRIPNWLVLAGIVAGMAWNVFESGWSGLGTAAAGLGLGFALYFPLFLLRARGAGDVKLLAAIGSITGPANCFWIFLLTALLGGVIGLVLVAARGRVHKTFANIAVIMRDLTHLRAPFRTSQELDVKTARGMRLPHGAILVAGVAAFLVIAQRGIRI